MAVVLMARAQANVMLAYPIPEAEDLLDNKLKTAQQSLANCQEDLDFLREQITVCSHPPAAIAAEMLTACRLWRSPLRAFIIGTLLSVVKKDLMPKKPRARSQRIEEKCTLRVELRLARCG